MKYETKYHPESDDDKPTTWYKSRTSGLPDCPACSCTGFVTIQGRSELHQGMWRIDYSKDELIYGKGAPPVERAIRCSCEWGHNRGACFGPAFDEVFNRPADAPTFTDADRAGLERALTRWGAQPRGGEVKTIAESMPKVAMMLPVAETASVESVIAGIRDDELPF